MYKKLFIEELDKNIENDFSNLYRKLYKKNRAMPVDEIYIITAKQIAKKYKIDFKDILKTKHPSSNIIGSKTWDRNGNIIKVK